VHLPLFVARGEFAGVGGGDFSLPVITFFAYLNIERPGLGNSMGNERHCFSASSRLSCWGTNTVMLLKEYAPPASLD
jgi:hypothetical protein